MPVGAEPSADQLARLAIGGSAMLPALGAVGGNRLRLLVDEAQAIPELLAAIRGARQQVDVAMFSFVPSGAGRQVVDALAERAREGVRVNVQVDQVGSMVVPGLAGSKLVAELQAAGVNVSVNRRYSLSGGVGAIDHRKVYVIDGTTVFTGGMNLSGKYGGWHDLMVRADGPVAAQAGAQFLARWVDEGAPATDAQAAVVRRGALAPEQGAAGAALLVNRPGVDMQATDHLVASLGAARDRAWIVTPSLTDPEMVQAIIQTARRGVDTRVAVSGRESFIGVRALRALGATWYDSLLEAGVKVYEQPGMAHAKAAIIDGVASVGSLNMTSRALDADHESVLVSDDASFVQQLGAVFSADFARAQPVGTADANGAALRVGRALRRHLGLFY